MKETIATRGSTFDPNTFISGTSDHLLNAFLEKKFVI